MKNPYYYNTTIMYMNYLVHMGETCASSPYIAMVAVTTSKVEWINCGVHKHI